MNVLTKLFVVALVVLSLLETAAFVVFVQRVQVTQKANDGLRNDVRDANAARDQAQAQIAGKDSEIARLNGEMTTRATAERTRASGLEQRISERENQIAELNKQIGTLQLDMANLSRQSELLATILDSKDKAYTAVRKESDDIAKKYDEVARTLQDRIARLEVAERELQASKEQIFQLQTQLTEANTKSQGGIAVAPRGSGEASAANVHGQVTKITKENGQILASINLGKADGVSKGTRFTVYDDQRGLFLGFLTVQAVDANSAMGTVEGPHVNEIAEGSSVQSQM